MRHRLAPVLAVACQIVGTGAMVRAMSSPSQPEPMAPAIHDPPRDVTGISAGLGLADVTITVDPKTVAGAWIELETTERGTVRVEMRRFEDKDAARERWTARVMRGSAGGATLTSWSAQTPGR